MATERNQNQETGAPATSALTDQVEVQLLHASSGSRVVLVQRRRGDWIMDGALGEAATAEEAEDRARQRLGLQRPPAAPGPALARTQAAAPVQRPPTASEAPPAPAPPPSAAPASAAPVSAAPVSAAQDSAPLQEPSPADPEDWSSELAQLDLQLQRLGWDRSMESRYLERIFGHPSRNRITNYGDLLAYLQALERFEPGTDPDCAAPPLRRSELLSQCDQLLEQLQWQPAQGRALLEEHFGRSSRQQLNDAQLLQFNILLESELLARSQNADQH